MTPRQTYDLPGHAHFLTFSCYKRRRLLDEDPAKRIVITILASQLLKQRGNCLGFVIMPNHVHALIHFPTPNQLSRFLKQWKQRSSFQIKRFLRAHCPAYAAHLKPPDPIWQPRYYDFNVYETEKVKQKLEYMHMNPVRYGLAPTPGDWDFSSAPWYLSKTPVGVPIGWP